MQLVQDKFTGRDGKERTSVKVIAAQDRPLNERWEPICEKRFMYEMTASFVLVPDRPGVGIPLKLQEQHRQCFPEGEQIGPQAGSRLSQWASGGAEPANPKPDPKPSGEDPEAARERWMKGYLARVNGVFSRDELVELQMEKKAALDQFREGDPERWQQITDAHTAAFEQLSEPE